MTIAKNLRELMFLNNIKATDLSKICGVPQPRISEILTGKTTNPQLKTLTKLAKGLGVAVDEIIDKPLLRSPVEVLSPKLQGALESASKLVSDLQLISRIADHQGNKPMYLLIKHLEEEVEKVKAMLSGLEN
ncbi:MAG: helix-turn-helix transcriptional regulator [Geobacter sp.]|nr:MAG: helix-turn-helix transcriptional regulator [Geobacter sp.]